MKSLFDDLSAQCSQRTTKLYSTSFYMGIQALDQSLHRPIHGIYGLVRFADEIVDSFHGYDKKELLQKFRSDTFEAIANRISLNPILNEFQKVVNDYRIDHSLIETFFESMEMDLEDKFHTVLSYKNYILGSAEVVGLMCLKVFVEGDQHKYNDLKPYAMSLGSAFQKVNFLRDIKADYETLGRTYFPNVDMTRFNQEDKREIEADISADFEHALIGIKRLPRSSRNGVYLAYIYYLQLFRKIKDTPAEKIMKTRIRIPNLSKLGLMFQTIVQHKLNLI
ncbi:MAG: phytoene/squalene synthase family protein [Flavobacteriales bacterium]|nr:phytoene/squalene synthase family protein [Flavobacteriales bacterium]